jgi:hypothetical protein
MPDLLRIDYINSLPQPLMATFIGAGDEWEVHDIEVETGLLRINVMGKLSVKHISDVRHFTDMDGTIYDAETFYCE